MHKNEWENRNIVIKKDDEAALLRKFIIYTDLKLIRTPLFTIIQLTDFITEIKKSEICTGIMISNLKINDILIYLFILDDKIFIIKRINLIKFHEYFNEHLDSLIFDTTECNEDFINAISTKDQISDQSDQFMNDSKTINETIKKEIIKSIIKKSHYRTNKMHHEILPDKYKSTNENYKFDDFISIQSGGFNLYYNSKDQILNVLKFYDDEKKFSHEINFYHQIENTFPFIRKIYGIIKQLRGFPIIILEYVEGDRLDNFLLSAKNIDLNIKIKIIEEILFSVYYIHCNERKISKSISLLIKASKNHLFIADLFLFYIFSNCDDKTFLNQMKSLKYENKCKVYFSLQMIFINLNYTNFQRLHNFLRDYDLIHAHNHEYDLFYFILNGIFYDWKMQIEDNTKENDRSSHKDINTDFYEGFNCQC